jgi:hypothetical protein
MEHTLEYMEACCTMTLDIKELLRIIAMYTIVYTMSQNRISELVGSLSSCFSFISQRVNHIDFHCSAF